jgi:hypothetical protein
MLPIRLGTLNADGTQDIIIMALTQKGRVEASNYRTVKIPSGEDIPLYVKDDFGSFYKAAFEHMAKRENYKAMFLEYAWDMSWCDPCAADPLPNDDLRTLGVWWLNEQADIDIRQPQPTPMPRRGRFMPAQGQDVFVTRLHARYTADSFPEDIMLHETADRENFQGRYVLRHPFKGDAECAEAKSYFASLPDRFEREAQTLAHMTGWNITEIRSEMEKNGQSFDVKDAKPVNEDDTPWWDKIWKR